MKLNLQNNALKTTISGNLFAIMGVAYFLIILLFVFVLCIDFGSAGGGVVFIASVFLGSLLQIQLILTLLLVITFIVELIKKHRIKNKFFSENLFYTILFYLGCAMNLVIYLCAIRLFIAYLAS